MYFKLELSSLEHGQLQLEADFLFYYKLLICKASATQERIFKQNRRRVTNWLIRCEQATFSCPFVTGEWSYQNHPASTAMANDEERFSLDMLIVHHVCMARSADFVCAKQTLFVNIIIN